MDRVVFDEFGNRAQKLTGWFDGSHVTRGWPSRLSRLECEPIQLIGFDPKRIWTPSWLAIRMARGWRLAKIELEPLTYLERGEFECLWAHEPDLRFPTLSALEAYLSITQGGRR